MATSGDTALKRVVIVQYRLLHYRRAFFQRLRDQCFDAGVELILLHGQPSASERLRGDTAELDWAIEVPTLHWPIADIRLLWQRLPAWLSDVDMVVVMQESRILSSYPLLLRPGKRRLAFWGHGNDVTRPVESTLRARWKRFWICKVDWWFSYTAVSTKVIEAAGYPVQRISTVQNAVDTRAFRESVEAVSADAVKKLEASCAIEPGDRVALFCGSVYKEKKIDLLLDACVMIHAALPNFHLIVIGGGPLEGKVKSYAARHDFIHYLGVQTGELKSASFRRADVMLNPGLLGLHILDAFSIGLPLVSTRGALHAPEIAYLEDGVNGLLVDSDEARAYADAVIELLGDSEYLRRIAAAALASGRRYTLDNMVQAFADGINACLEAPLKRDDPL
ncbi:MAG: glycosyltransferase family 4 protein [Pseudomonadota bacterium]